MHCVQVSTLSFILLAGLAPLQATPPLLDLHSSLLQEQETMNFTVEGKITKESPGKLTINTGENILFHVRYDDKTDIKKSDGSPGTAKDLRVGLQVRIEGELTEAGDILAQKIEIQKP
ncbi:MAG: DUF5666 domain-containing protein [Terriglobia bacterium]